MKIIRRPTVLLVGTSEVHNKDLDDFLVDHGVATWETDTDVGGEKLVEVSGRLCYMSFQRPRPGGNKTYIEHILDSGHGSVLEHSVYNFIITGVSRSFSHELVRHRAGWGFSQLSQRYVDESTAEYVEPDIIAHDSELHDLWVETIEAVHRAYVILSGDLLKKVQNEAYRKYVCSPSEEEKRLQREEWLSNLSQEERTSMRKEARQAARSVLPNATETKIFVTVNARAARHFLELRGSRHAEPEIRYVAYEMLKILQKESPNIFGDYTTVQAPNGIWEITTHNRKV